MLGRMADMELQQEQAKINIDQLYNNQESIVAKHEGTSIPGAISTSGETAFSANESQAKIINEVVVATMSNADKSRGNTRDTCSRTGGKVGAVWKQWKFWSWTCGVNISHDTAGHKGDAPDNKKTPDSYKGQLRGGRSRNPR